MLLGRVEAMLGRLQSCAADGPVYAFGHGQFMQALRLMLLHPGRSAREQMAHFGAFDAAHPIRNVDRMTIHWMEGVWTVDGAETPASAAGRRAF
ncbi:hypothetical protein [uncultured Xylophilus sp.]|uniref:hypothetical protein n=1 Tax=uncultured Xylophilus sp. TaxID=296832 RepID=UPI0025F685E4|nr:hypothetical protein [uncultured Xylophilus sp.]